MNDEQPKRERQPLDESTYQNVPSILLNHLRGGALEHIDIVIYALLKSHSRMTESCYPSYACLAEEARCSESSVQRSLRRLVDAQHIRGKEGNGTGKIFLLTDVAGGKVIRRTLPKPPPPPRKASPPEEDLPF
jgi:hypothetical protein